MKVHWRLGDYEVEVEGSEEFIEKNLDRFEKKLLSGNIVVQANSPEHRVGGNPDPRKQVSPAEFYRSARPSSGTKGLIALGKYLHDHRGMQQFSKGDLSRLTTDIRIDEVHPTDIARTIERGWLRETEPGFYAVTLTGDEIFQQILVQAKAAATGA